MRNEKQIHPLWRLHYGKNCSLAFPKNNKQWNIINCKPKTAMRTGKFFKRGESQDHVGRARMTCGGISWGVTVGLVLLWFSLLLFCSWIPHASHVPLCTRVYVFLESNSLVMVPWLVSTFSAAVDSAVGVGCLTGNLKHRGQTLYNISDLMVCTSHALRWFGCNFFFPPLWWSFTKGSHAKTEFAACVTAFVRQNCLAWMGRKFNQGCHKTDGVPLFWLH